jgi:hypothetical protein
VGMSLNGTASNTSNLRRPASAVFPSVLERMRWTMDEDNMARFTGVSLGLLALVMLGLSVLDRV